MKIITKIEKEIDNYISGVVEISPEVKFSAYRTIKRIYRFANRVYPTGNVDSQGNFKYWYEIIQQRIDSEIKNTDFDSKDIFLTSEGMKDDTAVFLANVRWRQFMRENGESEKINDIIEHGAGWGNILLEKTEDGFRKTDPLNTYVINQLLPSVEHNIVIQRAQLTQSQMRAKKGIWIDEAIEDALDNGTNKSYVSVIDGVKEEVADIPYYEVFQRDGEVSLAELKESQDKDFTEDDENTYVLARIITVGLSKDQDTKTNKGKIILFAEEMEEQPYKEYHRGAFKGRWWREGIYELLFDIQIRINEIGNSIARSLEFGSHKIFRSTDKSIYKNILTDMRRGDIIISKDLSVVDVKMPDLANYINDWNNLLKLADRLTNSTEIVQGEASAGTPFRLGALLNVNANKMFVRIREKYAIALRGAYQEFVAPKVFKNFSGEKVIEITGDPELLRKWHEILVNNWYNENLIAFGPHSPAVAIEIKENALDNLLNNKTERVKTEKAFWPSVKARFQVIIVGEGLNLESDLQTLQTFIALESDPVRRSALVEMAMKKKGMDVASLPKTPPAQFTTPVPQISQSASPEPAPAGSSGGEETPVLET